jgi:hypothetical protein
MEPRSYLAREQWLSLAPSLHIEEPSLFQNTGELAPAFDLTAGFREDGYVQGKTDWGLDLDAMADAVRALSAANVSPLFAFVYDEFWRPYFKLHRFVAVLLGGSYGLLPEFSILDVDPKSGGAGWRPHRDKGRQSLLEDGAPKSVTAWISLTPATPLNGCIYVVPPRHDPTYGTTEETELRFEYQSIRALPVEAGDFLIWNQALCHWGGKTSAAAAPRVSMALQFQRADLPAFAEPLLAPLQVLSLKARVQLIARQLHRYRHLHDLDPRLAELASAPLTEAAIKTVPLNPPAVASVPEAARNAPCPCGSGKRYKHCHGALK